MKHLLTLQDITAADFAAILDRAAQMKAKRSGYEHSLKGKSVGLIFFKPSTRTRVSFSAGVASMGGVAYYLGVNDLQLGRGEPIKDTARVLSRYLSAVVIRTFAQQDLEEVVQYSTIPIINGLTDLYHPCQALADFLTIREVFGAKQGVKVTYIGDGNNIAHSLLLGAALSGNHLICCSPQGYQPKPEIVAAAEKLARDSGAKLRVVDDVNAAAEGAQVIYTDIWASMGQEAEAEKRRRVFKDYQVDGAVMAKAAKDAIFMHLLPAHRGEEVTDEVIESPQSKVWDQAENRLWAQMALLEKLVAN